jgi:hypothetical protein
MSELDTKDRQELPDSDFAYIDDQGDRHLPINDDAHVRDALSRWSQTDYSNHADKEQARKKILAAAHKRGIDVSPDDQIVKG